MQRRQHKPALVQPLHRAILALSFFCFFYPWLPLAAAPLFYATNRQQLDTGFGIIRGTRGEHGISYATATATSTKKKSKTTFDFTNLSRDKFLDQVAFSVQENPRHECCVFIHGYNQESDDACASGLKLAEQLNEPVIVFDWVSQHKTGGYLVDECNAEWSLRHFQLLMQGLEDQLQNASRIMLVSHSMGNRLVTWYCNSRYDRHKDSPSHFSEIVLASPDVDRDTFKHYFFKLAKNADRIRIYISKRDKALLASSVVHGYERAGQSQGQTPLTWTKPGAVEDMETVDFSYLDKDWMGHSLQYELISNMHRSNTPGQGLQLLEDQHYKSFVTVAPQ
jgi:esterase/lipase superfamily enzyme